MLQSAVSFLHELRIVNLQRILVRPFGQNFNLFVSKLTMVLAILQVITALIIESIYTSLYTYFHIYSTRSAFLFSV